VLSWTLTLAPIFGPAAVVFAVYALAKRPTQRHKIVTHDPRPYDARQLERRYRDR